MSSRDPEAGAETTRHQEHEASNGISKCKYQVAKCKMTGNFCLPQSAWKCRIVALALRYAPDALCTTRDGRPA
jgi:hypothetical protein